MLNKNRQSQSSYFASLRGDKQNPTNEETLINNNDKDQFNCKFETYLSTEESPKGVYLIKDKRFTSSNISTQDTLMSRNTQITLETLPSVSSYISETAKPSFTTDTNTHRYAKSNSTIFSENQSLHSYYRTTVRTAPKNAVVLVNNLPYPTKLIFPSKIATPNHNTPIHYPTEREKNYFHGHQTDDSYDKILRVIEAYSY